MFQRDAVDTVPDLGDQNVLKTSETAIGHNRQTTRTELEFSVAGFIFTYVQNIFLVVLGGEGDRAPMDAQLLVTSL